MSAGRISSRYRVFSRAGGAGVSVAMRSSLSVQSLPAALGDAQPLAVDELDADTSRPAVLGIDEHHVGDVDRSLTLDHPARGRSAGGLLRALMALDDIEPLDVDLVLLG